MVRFEGTGATDWEAISDPRVGRRPMGKLQKGDPFA
jgi:hypothetical protein